MLKGFLLVFALFYLMSVVNAGFVFDRRLINATSKRVGRDFTGSVRYGTFIYNGACPSGAATGLSGIVVYAAVSGSCVTDSSRGNVDIGYICQTQGSSGKIHFSYPGASGFVIGGANFDSSALTSDGVDNYSWGVLGEPTKTPGTATASCEDSCTADYCSSKCTASCSTSAISSGETCSNTVDGGTARTYFFVPSGSTGTVTTGFGNCGSAQSCCSTLDPATPYP